MKRLVLLMALLLSVGLNVRQYFYVQTPIHFNTQPLWINMKPHLPPIFQVNEGSIEIHHHKGWRIRCLSIDEGRGIVQPNYDFDLAPTCKEPM